MKVLDGHSNLNFIKKIFVVCQPIIKHTSHTEEINKINLVNINSINH